MTRRGRGTPVDAGAIGRTAMELAREHGLERVTTRRLADRLGISTRTLDRCVRRREELVGLIVDAMDDALPTPPPGAGWEDLLRFAASGSRRLAERCPGIHRFLSEHRVPTRSGRAYMERSMGALVAAGLTVEDAADAFLTFTSWTTRYLAVDADARRRRNAGGPAPAAASEEDLLDSRVLRALVETIGSRTDEDEYATGVDLLIAGIAQRIAAARAEATSIGALR